MGPVIMFLKSRQRVVVFHDHRPFFFSCSSQQAASPFSWHLKLRVSERCLQPRNCVQLVVSICLGCRVPRPLCVLVIGSQSIAVLRKQTAHGAIFTIKIEIRSKYLAAVSRLSPKRRLSCPSRTVLTEFEDKGPNCGWRDGMSLPSVLRLWLPLLATILSTLFPTGYLSAKYGMLPESNEPSVHGDQIPTQ